MYPNIHFTQKVGLFDKNHFEILGNTELKITYKGWFKSHSRKIPLGAINPNPIDYKKVNLSALFVGLLCLLVLVASIYGSIKGLGKNNVVFMVAGLGSASFALLTLKNFFRSTAKLLLFQHSESDTNLFILFPSRGAKSEVNAFINTLTERIKSIRYPESLSLEQKKDIYYRHLHFLLNESVITEQELITIVERLETKKEKASVIRLV